MARSTDVKLVARPEHHIDIQVDLAQKPIELHNTQIEIIFNDSW